jgi:hypothetical protein
MRKSNLHSRQGKAISDYSLTYEPQLEKPDRNREGLFPPSLDESKMCIVSMYVGRRSRGWTRDWLKYSLAVGKLLITLKDLAL